MRRKRVSTTGILWAAGLALALLVPAACGTAREPRTVVLVVVDTLRRDALSCFGGERPTPELDALAARGVRFDQAISSAGWTLPSMASLLTGVSPPVHRATGKVSRLTPVSPDVTPGAESLRRLGVRTLAFTNAAFVNPLLGLTRGFERVSHEHAYNHEIRRAEATIDAALAALAEEDGRDTFCLIHLFDPHLDYDPPGGWKDVYTEHLADPRRPLRYEDCTRLALGESGERPPAEHVARVRSAYDAEVRYVDAQIGRLLAEIGRRGRLASTAVLVTADHGEEFWEHGGFEHGHTLFDELVRVPLLLAPPSDLDVRRRTVEEQVRLLDVLPTVFELLGRPVPADLEGRSLLPLVRGEPDEPREAFLDGTLYGSDLLALRTGRYKLVRERGAEAGTEHLFDLERDPGEARDVAAAEPEVTARLRARLDALQAELERRGAAHREGSLQDLSPGAQAETLRTLSALGYLRGD